MVGIVPDLINTCVFNDWVDTKIWHCITKNYDNEQIIVFKVYLCILPIPLYDIDRIYILRKTSVIDSYYKPNMSF